MGTNFSNVAVATTLATAGIDDTVTTLDVASATGYPAVPFNILLDDEVIRVVAKSSVTFSSLVRGYDGTVAASHLEDAAITHVVIAEDVAPGGLAGTLRHPTRYGAGIAAVSMEGTSRQQEEQQ